MHIVACNFVCSFSLCSQISSYENATLYLSVLYLTSTWIVSGLAYYEHCCYEHSCICLLANIWMPFFEYPPRKVLGQGICVYLVWVLSTSFWVWYNSHCHQQCMKVLVLPPSQNLVLSVLFHFTGCGVCSGFPFWLTLPSLMASKVEHLNMFTIHLSNFLCKVLGKFFSKHLYFLKFPGWH